MTGSARLDLYRRGGDSLMGRYLPYRVHPFSVGETDKPGQPDSILEPRSARFHPDDLIRLSGFPEPLLAGKETHAKRWSRLRNERLLGEDVRDLRAVNYVSALRFLSDLLPSKVGSLLSINSLQEDVGVAYSTLRDWVSVFESLYQSFLVRPYSKRVTRSLKATPKLDFFDILRLGQASDGARRENLVAFHLLKACHYWTDAAWGEFELFYLRDKEQREIDFLVTRKKLPWLMLECKSNDTAPSKHFASFSEHLPMVKHGIQLVTKAGFERHYPELGVRVLDWQNFLTRLP